MQVMVGVVLGCSLECGAACARRTGRQQVEVGSFFVHRGLCKNRLIDMCGCTQCYNMDHSYVLTTQCTYLRICVSCIYVRTCTVCVKPRYAYKK